MLARFVSTGTLAVAAILVLAAVMPAQSDEHEALTSGPSIGQLPGPSGDPSVVSPDARVEELFTEAFFTEGPAVAPDGSVYFSDITFTAGSGMQAVHIWRYDPSTGATVVFRSPSGAHSRHMYFSITVNEDRAISLVIAGLSGPLLLLQWTNVLQQALPGLALVWWSWQTF